ncbi:MAG: UDP-glucose 4-epimerase GalE [SAR324 cluster bacterium]|nr:UDP-glucose 4-epimerase GalE [SAR324 cluster bacterium]
MNHCSTLKVLVVGGAGYIGSHVTKALAEAGYQPTVFDNLSTGLRKNLLPGTPFIHGDILISDQIAQGLKNMDAIIHLAALKAAGESMIFPEKYATHNLTGTINLLNAAVKEGITKFVFSSSAAVYGEPKYVPMDENHSTEPINFYGYTKLEIERLLNWYDQLKGLRSVCLRYFNAAGYDIDGQLNGLEQNPQNLFPIVMETIMGIREYVPVFGEDYDTPDGTGIRDYIHVSDLAKAHVKALNYLETEDKSQCINLGTASGLSVKEVLRVSKEHSKIDFEIRTKPRRPGDPPKVLADSRKALKLLKWSAQHSDVDTIVSTMLKAYQS